MCPNIRRSAQDVGFPSTTFFPVHSNLPSVCWPDPAWVRPKLSRLMGKIFLSLMMPSKQKVTAFNIQILERGDYFRNPPSSVRTSGIPESQLHFLFASMQLPVIPQSHVWVVVAFPDQKYCLLSYRSSHQDTCTPSYSNGASMQSYC